MRMISSANHAGSHGNKVGADTVISATGVMTTLVPIQIKGIARSSVRKSDLRTNLLRPGPSVSRRPRRFVAWPRQFLAANSNAATWLRHYLIDSICIASALASLSFIACSLALLGCVQPFETSLTGKGFSGCLGVTALKPGFYYALTMLKRLSREGHVLGLYSVGLFLLEAWPRQEATGGECLICVHVTGLEEDCEVPQKAPGQCTRVVIISPSLRFGGS